MAPSLRIGGVSRNRTPHPAGQGPSFSEDRSGEPLELRCATPGQLEALAKQANEPEQDHSICHVAGRRPFASRDKATNFWPLALLSFGESWHNSHHADPTAARHGVLPGQLDPAARLIWVFEKLRWAHDVRRPNSDRLGARLLPNSGAPHGSSG